MHRAARRGICIHEEADDARQCMLPRHGRHGYHPWRGRPQRACAGGAWLAVYLSVNLEHFASGEGLGAELAPGAPQPDVLNHA
jgi:hypothetical protein